jgi:hypothetical protein
MNKVHLIGMGDFVVAIYFSQGQIWANNSHAQTLKEKKLTFLP